MSYYAQKCCWARDLQEKDGLLYGIVPPSINVIRRNYTICFFDPKFSNPSYNESKSPP